MFAAGPEISDLMVAAWHVPHHLIPLVCFAIGIHLGMEATLNRIARAAQHRSLAQWEG